MLICHRIRPFLRPIRPPGKPMKIELMFDPAKAPPAPLLNRVTPAPRPAGGAAPMEGVQRFVDLRFHL